mmetsp:Transcript_271/g.344  ORF Transcript_271/g.344 Transcript_271/m.344 type:complete len:567 (-) Transcript_271:191-1891(-)|eukprot:CAMPEP_0185769318 /NCGR_PEP_ID=MMETSP1174-20130828/53510_1 /TAXON_ID=35687 /ORGANISM="Dictyocha speculum, Strain CCMP1381" /LENGTH=566 /DNA_ID=CAMNT_0028454323 /DNA_START=89 /DNA_END=1789 /DNA_ORIENTATION=+
MSLAVLRPPTTRAIEPVGQAHFEYALENLGHEKSQEQTDAGATTSTKKKKHIFTPGNIAGLNYYELLCLDPLGISVDNEKIKRAYHRALLTYHPDKTGRGDEDEVFLAIQDAYTTLSNETKRRAYDSQNEFDDSIPTGRETTDFYETYGPVLHSNGRFAVKLPVPELGDESTPIEEVWAMYDYWENFESWRNFDLEEKEHDPEQADSREERRWMIKENERGTKGRKKKEYQRISSLVERAKARDPRIARAQAEERERRRAKKQAKVDEEERIRKESAEAEAREQAKAEEIEARRKEEAKVAKLEREKVKKIVRRLRNLLRRFLKAAMEMEACPENLRVTVDQIETLCDEATREELEEIVALFGEDPDQMSSCPVDGLTMVHKTLAAKVELAQAEAEKELQRKREQKSKQMVKQKEQKAANATPWSSEELSTLAKAVRKFPAGQQKRWQLIADYLNGQVSPKIPKNKLECIAKYQELHAKPAEKKKTNNASPVAASTAPKTPNGTNSDEWTQEQQRQLEAGLVGFPAAAFTDQKERWKKIAEGVTGRSRKHCIERYKFLRSSLESKK